MFMPKEMVAFLPWLQLKHDKCLSIGPVSFVPFSSCCSKIEGVSSQGYEDLKKILSSYKDLEGHPVKEATLLCLNDDWKLTRDRDEDEIVKITNIAAFSAISTNQYFTETFDHYANASLFKPVFQTYRVGAPHLVIRTRRRDAYSDSGGYDHGKVNITCPFECKDARDVEVDESLAQAVWNAKDTPVGRKIITSLSFFCLANTDSEQMELDAEVIQMASAFDQVFELGTAKAYELAIRLGEMFKSYDSVLVESSKGRMIWMGTRKDGRDVPKEEQKGWKIVQKWIEEFYHFRNEKVHGDKRRGPDEWAWSMNEHLIMAVFVFPLVVKHLLKQERFYSLTDDDKKKSNAIDFLLATKPGRWAHRREECHDVTIWTKLCQRWSKCAAQEIIDETDQELGKSDKS
jgi:hypothetical protein